MRNLFGGDPYFSNVVLQLPLRSHLRDESKAPKAVTVNGDTKIVNDATYFDGVGDYLAPTSSSDFAFGSNDFTIEFWAYPIGISTDQQIYEPRPNSTQGAYFAIYRKDFNRISVYVNSVDFLISSTNTFNANTWYHIAACRSGTTTRLFIDGILQASGTDSNNYIIGASRPLIGIWQDASSYGYNGYLKDFRITNGIARYTSNFIPPTKLPTHGVAATKYKAVPIKLSEVTRPKFIKRNTFIYSGSTQYWKYPEDLLAAYYGDKVLKIRNTCINVSVPSSGTDTIAQSQFGYIKTKSGAYVAIATTPTSLPNTGATIIAEVNTTNSTTPNYQRFITVGTGEGLVLRGATGSLHVYGYVNGVFRELLQSGGYQTGRHIYAGTYDGSVFKLYRDGSLLTTSSTYAGTLTNFYGGALFNNSSTEYIAGSLIRAFVFTRALSLSEINYWSYGVNFSQFVNKPSNQTFLNDNIRPHIISNKYKNSGDTYFNNVEFQASMRGAIRDESIARRALTINGNTYCTANNEAYLDGNGDYIEILSSSDIYLGTKDFSIDFKVKFTAWPSNWNGYYYSCLLGKNSVTKEWVIYANGTSSSYTSFSFNGSSNGSSWAITIEAPISIKLNTEYSVRFSRISGIGTFYIDGIPIVSNSFTTNIYSGSQNIFIGRDNTSSLWYGYPTAYIRDVRITLDVSRYTSDLTVPASFTTHGVSAASRKITVTSTVVIPETGKVVLYLDKRICDIRGVNTKHPLFNCFYSVAGLPTQEYWNKSIYKNNTVVTTASNVGNLSYTPGKGIYLNNTTNNNISYANELSVTSEFTQIIRFKPNNATSTTTVACTGNSSADAAQCITCSYGGTTNRGIHLDCGTNNTTVWTHYSGVYKPILRLTQTINQECWYVIKTKSNTIYLSIYTLSGSLIASTSGAPCTGNPYSFSYSIGNIYHIGTGYASSLFTFTKLLSAEEESNFIRNNPYSIINM
jgi:hypothetical protein